MDDLEKAILFSYEPGGNVDPGVRSQAMAYCDQIKQAPSICRFCIERLSSTDLVPVQFWCLQTIHDSLRSRYSSMDPTERAFLRDSLISIARADDAKTFSVSGGPAFIRNKFAQVFVALLCSEFPSVWPTAFLDLIPHLGKRVPIVIDMFTRVLHSLDDELISMDYPRSTDEIAVAGRIKDAMREQCITQIAGAWYTIVSLYRNSDPDTVAMVLDTVRRYIAWIDIGLIANDAFVPLIFDIVLNNNNVNVNNNDNNNNAPSSSSSSSSSEQLRATAASCILALVSKRMDPHQKLVLLHNLQINRVFSLVTGSDDDSELVLSKLAALITRYASEALECSKQLGSRDVEGASMKLLEDALPAVFSIMQNHEVDSHFLSDYVSATMKSQSPSPKQAVHMGQILGVIRGQICYDPIYRNNLELLDKIGKEEEDQMVERRKELFTLLRGVGRVAPEATQLFVRNLLTNVLASSEMNVEEVEAALSLFYHLGDSMSDSEMRAGSGLLREFVPMLLSARFSCHSHRIVAIVYLETVMKYMKFVQENAQYVPLVLTAFLDDRGMRHPNLNVRRRASYLFMRTVKLLKAELVPFIDTILQSLLDTVASFTSLDCTSKGLNRSGSKDDSLTFEAIGLLLGMDIVSPEKQSKYLFGLLNPLCHQVESLLLDARAHRLEESSVKIGGLQEVIVAINALSKGFSERLVTTIHPEIGIMFKQMLDVLLQILVLFPDVDPLRHKITSFLHRMVEILGASVFPYLPMVLEQLLAKSEPKEIVNFLVLINQLVCKFNTTVGGILEEVFPAIASRLFHTLPRDALPLGPGSNTEEIRELQELQRTFFMFLHVLATHDLSSILLAPKSRRYLDLIMQLLLSTSCNHKDIVDRKLCVQIIVRLIKDWCIICNGEEKVPGFRSFIIETFATNCCLYSVLDKSFEFKDSSTLVLFGEIVVAQKVMYEHFGDDFVIQFVSKGLPAAQCPQDLAEQYYLKLQGNDIKALKDFYQSLIENLRRQQNGSLDVR